MLRITAKKIELLFSGTEKQDLRNQELKHFHHHHKMYMKLIFICIDICSFMVSVCKIIMIIGAGDN
jgi:hypothetical protein